MVQNIKNIPCSLRAQRIDSRQEPWLKPRMPEVKEKSFYSGNINVNINKSTNSNQFYLEHTYHQKDPENKKIERVILILDYQN